jgi:hypothetical protein
VQRAAVRPPEKKRMGPFMYSAALRRLHHPLCRGDRDALVLRGVARRSDHWHSIRGLQSFEAVASAVVAVGRARDTPCGYRMVRRALAPHLLDGTSRFDYEIEVLIIARRQEFHIATVPISTIYGLTVAIPSRKRRASSTRSEIRDEK